MPAGAITGYVDVAQLTLYAFILFFFGLVFYLRQEDKREGYPLETDTSPRDVVQGFPPMPAPKTFILADGEEVRVPRVEEPEQVAARFTAPWFGAPLEPIGNPMVDGVGPAAYARRADVPERTIADGTPTIVPLRVDPRYFLASEDPDPRGYEVVGADGVVAGTVRDVWVDRGEVIARYLEVTTGAGGRNVLVPMTLSVIRPAARQVVVHSVGAAHFADAPAHRNPDEVTILEEDKISAFFGSGHLYATPERMGPIL